MIEKWPKEGYIFEVPGKVKGKGRPRFVSKGKFVQTYTPKDTAAYEKLIKMSYLKHTRYCSLKSVKMSIYVCFAPNKSDTKKNRAIKLENSLLPGCKPDIDNILKIVLDALNSVAYVDDTQVNEMHAIRHYDESEKLIICLSENGELMNKKVKKS